LIGFARNVAAGHVVCAHLATEHAGLLLEVRSAQRKKETLHRQSMPRLRQVGDRYVLHRAEAAVRRRSGLSWLGRAACVARARARQTAERRTGTRRVGRE
jgi:hypothetical protein